MISIKSMSSYHRLYKFLGPLNPSLFLETPLNAYSTYLSIFSNVKKLDSTVNPAIPFSSIPRNFSSCTQLVSEKVHIEVDSTDSDECSNKLVKKGENRKKGRNNLGVKGNGDLLKSEKEKNGSFKKGVQGVDSKLKEIDTLKKKLQKLEMEIRGMKVNGEKVGKKEKSEKGLKLDVYPSDQSKATSLYSVFTSKPSNRRPVVCKQEKSSSYVKLKPMKREKCIQKELPPNNRKPVTCTQDKGSSCVKLKPTKKEKCIQKELSPNNRRPVACTQEKGSSYVKLKSVKEKSIRKELSPEMVSLVGRLHEGGYLNKENFLPAKEMDVSAFANDYPRDFLRFAAEKFGQDHQEIAKWLSGNNLKAVALFGCPSLDKKSVLAAKRLRTFFNIQEDIACRACQLKSSCKSVNQRVWGKMNTLSLADTMRVLTTYSLDSTPQSIIPKEINISINKLLKEVVDLSQ